MSLRIKEFQMWEVKFVFEKTAATIKFTRVDVSVKTEPQQMVEARRLETVCRGVVCVLVCQIVSSILRV